MPTDINISLASGDLLSMSRYAQDVYMNEQYTAADLLNVVNSNLIPPRYKIYILYPDESINYEIPNSDIANGGSYSENYQDGQRRSLSFTLYNGSGKYSPNINNIWANTRVRFDLGIEMPDNTTIWVQKGIFIVKNATASQTRDGLEEVSVECSDKFALFEDKTGTLEMTYEIPIGTDIQEAINGVLCYDSGNSYPLDPKKCVYHSSFKGKKTQVTISKSAGDSLGSILLELATQLSAEIFYNSQGLLTVVPTSDTTSDGDKPLLTQVTAEGGDYDQLSLNFDMTSIVNRIIVLGSSNNGRVFKAIAVNDDPASPLCYQRIGYRTGEVINDSNITSDNLAQERAKYELRKQLILKSSTSLTVTYNPLLTVNNLVAITNDFYEMKVDKFLIQSISCSLDYSSSMSISLTNITNLPFIN